MTLGTLLENETITEAPASVEDITGVLKGMKNTDFLKVAVMNRERTNHSTSFQADYFYGDQKELSKSDSKTVVNGMLDIEKALKKSGIGGRVTDQALWDALTGGLDAKKYFKDMR